MIMSIPCHKICETVQHVSLGLECAVKHIQKQALLRTNVKH